MNTILIIDDEENLRRSLALILVRNDYKVTCAANAQEGLIALNAGPFDLVFLDLKLPDRDGIAILPEIRCLYPEMPVVILTAHATLDSAMQAVRQGANDYLLKPIQPEHILRRTEEIIASQKQPTRRREILSEMQSLLGELHQMDGMVDESTTSSKITLVESGRYIHIGDITLDLHIQRAIFQEREISIPPSSFDYLVTLARHSPEPVPFITLVLEAQGFSTSLIEARELARVHIHVLRKAIEVDLNHPRYIITARNVGYRFVT